jgi:hypothetical protein
MSAVVFQDLTGPGAVGPTATGALNKKSADMIDGK